MSSEFEEYRVLKNREVEKLKPLLTPLRLRAHRLRGGVLALPRKLNLEALPGGVFSAGKRGYGEYTPKGIHLVHAQGVQYMCCLAHSLLVLLVRMFFFKAIPTTSFAARLKDFVETRDVLSMLGLVGMAIMLSIGVFSWFRVSEAMQVADLLSSFGEAFMVREAPRWRALHFCRGICSQTAGIAKKRPTC